MSHNIWVADLVRRYLNILNKSDMLADRDLLLEILSNYMPDEEFSKAEGYSLEDRIEAGIGAALDNSYDDLGAGLDILVDLLDAKYE